MADACDCISAQFWSEVSCIDLQGPLFHCNDINPCCSWGSQSRPIFHLVKHMCRGINAFPFLFLVTKRQLPDNTCELLHRSVSVTHFAFQQQGDYVSFYCNISLKQFLFYWCIVVFSLSPPPTLLSLQFLHEAFSQAGKHIYSMPVLCFNHHFLCMF